MLCIFIVNVNYLNLSCMNKSAEYWINHLNLLPHPEGGFYKEVYRSEGSIPADSLSDAFDGDRSYATSIYFLLRSEDISKFHILTSDELWFFHDGSPVTIHQLNKDGVLTSVVLGEDVLQTTISKDVYFGAEVTQPDSYCLVSCVVAPGFDFADFYMPPKEEMMGLFPEHASLIERFT